MVAQAKRVIRAVAFVLGVGLAVGAWRGVGVERASTTLLGLPTPSGNFGQEHPVFRLGDLEVIIGAETHRQAARALADTGVRAVMLFLGVSLVLHSILWNTFRDQQNDRWYKAIDYIWFLGALVAGGLAAVDFSARSSANQLETSWTAYRVAKEYAINAANRISGLCKAGGVGRESYWVCEHAPELRAEWEGGLPLVEKGVLNSDRLYELERWGMVHGRTYDPLSRSPHETKLCKHLRSAISSSLGAEAGGLWGLSFDQFSTLKKDASWVEDAITACRATEIGRQVARDIALGSTSALLAAKHAWLRHSWPYALAVLLAVRLLKTAFDVANAKSRAGSATPTGTGGRDVGHSGAAGTPAPDTNCDPTTVSDETQFAPDSRVDLTEEGEPPLRPQPPP